MSKSTPRLSIEEIIKPKFDDLLNLVTEQEYGMKMEMESIVKVCDALKKENESLRCRMEIMKRNLEMELGRNQRRCEELKARLVEMEEINEKLRDDNLMVEEMLEKSENKCEELRNEGLEANRRMEEENETLRREKSKVEEKLKRRKRKCKQSWNERFGANEKMEEEMGKLRHEKLNVEKKLEMSQRKCEELMAQIVEANKRKEFATEGGRIEKELQGKNVEITESDDKMRVKKMDLDMSAQLYKSRLADLDLMKTQNRANFVAANATPLEIPGDSGGIGLCKKGANYGVYLHRCCNVGIINEIKQCLGMKNLEIFEGSCFGHLLKINQLKYQGQLMLQLLLHMDVSASNKERLVFKIKNSSLEFGVDDFHRVTGLHCGPSTSEATRFLPIQDDDEGCGVRPRVRLNDVAKGFLDACRDDKGRGEMSLKLAFLYFLYGTLLASNPGLKKIDVQYCSHLVKDLHEFNTFPWGRVAFDFLVSSILGVRKCMDDSVVCRKRRQIKINGFVFALQIWAYEVMPCVAELCAARAHNFENLSPQILRWIPAKNAIRFNDLEKFFASDDKTHLAAMGRCSSSFAGGRELIFICDSDEETMPESNISAGCGSGLILDWSRKRDRSCIKMKQIEKTTDACEDSDEESISDGYMNNLVAKLRCQRS